MSNTIPQMHFDFNDVEEAKRTWEENVELFGEDNIQVVISVHPHTSGIWVEAAGTEQGDYELNRIYTHKEAEIYFTKYLGKRKKTDLGYLKIKDNHSCEQNCDPFFIKTDKYGMCLKCGKNLGYVR